MYFVKLVAIIHKKFKQSDGTFTSGYSAEFLRYEDESLEEPMGEQKALWVDEANGDKELLKLLQENVKGFFSCELTFEKNPKIKNIKLIKPPKQKTTSDKK